MEQHRLGEFIKSVEVHPFASEQWNEVGRLVGLAGTSEVVDATWWRWRTELRLFGRAAPIVVVLFPDAYVSGSGGWTDANWSYDDIRGRAMMISSSTNRHPVVVCANLVVEQNALLLVREAKASALHRWSLPAGKLEPGETLQQGAEREALEETGLAVAAGPLVGIYHCLQTLEGGAAVNFVFLSTIVGGEIQTSPEHPEVRFIALSEVERLTADNMIRGRHVPIAVAAALAGTTLGDDIVDVVAASAPPATRR